MKANSDVAYGIRTGFTILRDLITSATSFSNKTNDFRDLVVKTYNNAVDKEGNHVEKKAVKTLKKIVKNEMLHKKKNKVKANPKYEKLSVIPLILSGKSYTVEASDVSKVVTALKEYIRRNDTEEKRLSKEKQLHNAKAAISQLESTA